MNISLRYGLALLIVVGYYAHAFVPLLSITTSLPDDTQVPVQGLEFLQGIALYDYHYLSIGIVPFIFASLLSQLLRWQTPEVFSRISGPKGDAALFQRGVTYTIGAIIAFFIVKEMDPDRFRLSPVLTWVELVFTLTAIEQLLNFLKKLNILSSPVMLFLGLNVFSGISYSVFMVDYQSLSREEWAYAAAAVALGALTIFMVIFSFYWKKDVVLGRAISVDGRWVEKKIGVKCLLSGISPVVYSSFVTFPLAAFIWPGRNPLVTMLENPWIIPIFSTMVFFFSYKLSLFASQWKELSVYIEEKGIVAVGHASNTKQYLKRILKKNAALGALWFTSLMAADGLWRMLSPDKLADIGFIGGIGVVLMLNVAHDLYRNYFRIKREMLLHG